MTLMEAEVFGNLKAGDDGLSLAGAGFGGRARSGERIQEQACLVKRSTTRKVTKRARTRITALSDPRPSERGSS